MKLEYVEAGEIVTTHGVSGEVKVFPWMDSAEALKEYSRCRIRNAEYKIQKCRIQKNCCLIKLEGVDTMDDAEMLRGSVILLYRNDVPEGMVFAAEIIGMDAWADGKCIGTVQDVLDYPGNLVYIIQGEYEYRVPAVKEFVLNIDVDNNRMDLRLLEGMRVDED